MVISGGGANKIEIVIDGWDFLPEPEIKGHIRSDSLDSIVKEANKPAIVIDAWDIFRF